MANRTYTLMLLFLVTLANAAMMLQFDYAVRAGSPVVARIFTDFLVVAVLNTAASMVLPFVRTQRTAMVILALKSLLALLVGIPLADQPAIRTILLCTVVFELQVYAPEPAGLLVAGAAILLSAIGPREILAWDLRIRSPSLLATMQSVALEVAALVGGWTLRVTRGRIRVLEEQSTALERTISQLISANKGFQDYAQVAREAAEREERMRISRDIHDTVGYTLTNLIVMMESATDFSRIDPPKAEELLEQARDIAVKGLEDTRRSLRMLRSADPNRLSGLRMVQQIVNTFAAATAINVSVEYGNLPWSLGEDVDAAICHVTQESLINAFRHGRASRICVTFWLQDHGVRVSISDNGRGAASITEGIGFQGMQERIRRLGGSFVAGNDGNGFSVVAVIPLSGTVGEPQ